jgi:SAM-dependent methyltransferase
VADSPSLPFDRIADRYDETRGGPPRGRQLAAVIAPWLGAGPVLEVAIGTGLVAAGLNDLGHEVVGVDLAPAMVARARERLGPRIAVGDALALPVASAAVGAVAIVAALHVIGDVAGALREAARVVRPGGRVVTLFAPGARQDTPTDLSEVLAALPNGDRPDKPAAVHAAAAAAGLTTLVAERLSIPTPQTETPRQAADDIRNRTWSNLWRLDADAWQREIEPILDRLRALPDQDRPRERTLTFELVAFQR